jgi:hypothetical protein
VGIRHQASGTTRLVARAFFSTFNFAISFALLRFSTDVAEHANSISLFQGCGQCFDQIINHSLCQIGSAISHGGAQRLLLPHSESQFRRGFKIHLGLGQALAKLNSYDRSTSLGKRTCVQLVLYLDKKRTRVIEDKFPETQ